MDGTIGFLKTLVEFILAFGLLVFLHELGHYLASKLFHIEVEEFGFGFPPRIVKLFQFQETEFTLNWLPFGAFVRPKGENDPTVVGGLAAANPWARLVVLFAGPLMNLVIGIVLFSMIVAFFGEEDPTAKKVLVSQVSDSSPAQKIDMRPGDFVTAVNGQAVSGMDDFRNKINQNLGKEVTLTIERNGQTQDLKVTPRPVDQRPTGQGALGITMGTIYRPVASTQWLPRGFEATVNQIRLMITLPIQLIRGAIPADQGRFVGPVGIFNVFSAARQQDAQMAAEANQPSGIATLSLLAVLSVALGVTNLLPFPALDGGRILFVLPEILLRRRVPAKYENMVHLIGFAALLVLMIYVTTQDIINPLKIR